LTRLNETVTGFLWGLGFAISSVLVYIAFLIYANAGIAYKNQMVIEELYREDFASYTKLLEPEVLNYEIADGAIWINSRAKESSLRSYLKERAFLRFTLLNEGAESVKPNLISVCSQELVAEHSDEEWSYYQTKCSIELNSPKDVNRIKVTIAGK